MSQSILELSEELNKTYLIKMCIWFITVKSEWRNGAELFSELVLRHIKGGCLPSDVSNLSCL